MTVRRKGGWMSVLTVLCGAGMACAQDIKVTGHLVLVEGAESARPKSPGNAVVWLTPLTPPASRSGASGVQASPRHLKLVQKHKRFDPHLLVVPLGSAVDFPNNDPVFHNVFSLFRGKRFDVGLYDAGTTRAVLFDRPGICYIFCNIHPEMSAVVVVLETPYFAVADEAGEITIPNVPAGRYWLEVWHERCLPEFLNSLSREITISEGASYLGTIRLVEAGDLQLAHKNKYGREYDVPTPRSPLYQQP